MEYEDQEEDHDDDEEEEEEEEEEDMGIRTSYDSLGDVSRVKMTASSGETEAAAAADETTTTTSGGSSKTRYRECLKNHAVGIGGHAVDGCGEFMPGGTEGTLDALKCAACNCHRNFHRKEFNDSLPSSHAGGGGGELFFHGSHRHHFRHQYPVPQFTPYYRAPTGYLYVAPQQQRPLALPSTSGGGQSREDQEDVSNPSGGGGSSRKRFRTKFSQEQKERMLEFAERLGWRIQRHDETLVQQFCNEIGIKRHVLKVWMHNNKNTLGFQRLGDH